MRIFLQFISIVVLFFASWFGLSRVNWVKIFKIEEAAKNTEEKLGDLYWELISATEEILWDDTVNAQIDTLVTRICEANNIDRDKIHLHIIKKDEINAFALPDHHLVVFTGLIKECESEEELCGVLSHEMGHIEMDHVMQKLVKEIGLSVLISSTAGEGGEAIRESLKVLSSTAYDREMEKQADLEAVRYMINTNLDPEPFANFLYRMALAEDEFPDQLFWISTHPASEERSKYIIDELKKKKKFRKESILGKEKWKMLRERVRSEIQ